MPGIDFVDKMYARKRLCRTILNGQHSDYEQNICQEFVLLAKCMPGIGYVDHRRPKAICFVNQ